MNTLRCPGFGHRHIGSLAAMAWLACAQAVTAAPPVTDGFECTACPVLFADELEARRGGFEFAGLNFEFGANIRSYIDNRLVLESIITITHGGTIQHQAVTLPDSIPEVVATLPDSMQSAGDARTLGPDSPNSFQSESVAASIPATVDLSGLGNALGVSVNDRKGFTAALHEATRQRITSTIINTANHRELRQELEVKVNVENFRQFHESVRQTLLNSRTGASRLR